MEKDQVEMISKSLIEQIQGVQKGKNIFQRAPPKAKKSAFDLNKPGYTPLKMETQNKKAQLQRSATNIRGGKF